MGSLPVVVCLCFVLPASVLGHGFKTGACPSVDAMQNFDPRQFLGVWFIIQKTSTTSNCLKLNITEAGESYKVREYARTYPLAAAGVNHTTIYDGTLSIPDQTRPSQMALTFRFGVLGRMPFTIVDTDYGTYALTWSCKRLLFGHVHEAQILSRTPTLPNNIMDKMRRKIESFGIDSHGLSFIDQSNCSGMLRSKADNDGIFSLGPVHINRGGRQP